jgi:hypothetical protein
MLRLLDNELSDLIVSSGFALGCSEQTIEQQGFLVKTAIFVSRAPARVFA